MQLFAFVWATSVPLERMCMSACVSVSVSVSVRACVQQNLGWSQQPLASWQIHSQLPVRACVCECVRL